MFAKERQAKICSLLKENAAVTTAELVEKFNISVETVRRDLILLEQNKQLQRVHGGAVSIGETKPFRDLSYRVSENDKKKSELSKVAADFISEGDIIGIDAGSTAIYFAEALKERFSRLTIVTYSIDVFDILSRFKDFHVILCGGDFLSEENVFVGALTMDVLRQLHVQKAFVFPSAISMQNGLCDYQRDMYPLQKQMISCGEDIYILADSSKFEKNALLKIDDMRSSYTYVTDSGISEKIKAIYEGNGLKIVSVRRT